ncbi:MAG TPA: hypothetical protein VLG47_03785 [Candidatus Saccharimonadales bacterium]|nr:hypothetical protein [Candidatus Saccharimonadales bacterium]
MDPEKQKPFKPQRIRTVDGIIAPIKLPVKKPAVSKQAPKNRFKMPVKKIAITIIALIVVASIGWWLAVHKNSQLPQHARSYAKSEGFSIYYPDKLPQNFSLDKQSIMSENGVVLYKLKNGEETITVSEQKEPNPPPNFDALTQTNTAVGAMAGGVQAPDSNKLNGFIKLSTPIGQAVQGNGKNNYPIVFVSTGTTLINISGSQNLSNDLLVQLVGSLKQT